MNLIQRKIQKILRYFKKEKVEISLGKVGVIEPSDLSLEKGISDKYNHIIKIYSSVDVSGNNIRWGKVIEEIPYLEEEVKNLQRIKEIPIVARKIDNEFKFIKGVDFGEVLN